MLSDAERRTLDQIERRLVTEEPDLARVMTSGRAGHAWLYYVVMTLFGALGVLLLAIGSVGSAMLCLLVAAATVVLHRHPLRIR